MSDTPQPIWQDDSDPYARRPGETDDDYIARMSHLMHDRLLEDEVFGTEQRREYPLHWVQARDALTLREAAVIIKRRARRPDGTWTRVVIKLLRNIAADIEARGDT